MPLFVMSKKSNEAGILFPDWQALGRLYQVIEDVNVEKMDYIACPWSERENKLIWRGSSAYHGKIIPDGLEQNLRIKLCDCSLEHPQLIDAGFTNFAQIVPELYKKIENQYGKSFMPWEHMLNYKYQIWIDGNAPSYSNSGWLLYSGSTVLKVNSEYTQWYYKELIPGVHYVPVKEDLSDLVDQLLNLKNHEDYAQEIALNSVKFAREHISYEAMLLYLKELLFAYSDLTLKKEILYKNSKRPDGS